MLAQRSTFVSTVVVTFRYHWCSALDIKIGSKAHLIAFLSVGTHGLKSPGQKIIFRPGRLPSAWRGVWSFDFVPSTAQYSCGVLVSSSGGWVACRGLLPKDSKGRDPVAQAHTKAPMGSPLPRGVLLAIFLVLELKAAAAMQTLRASSQSQRGYVT